MSESEISCFQISPTEANDWWRKNDPAGVILNRLLLLFILVPIGLVWKHYYVASFIVFAFMIPYGLWVRRLAIRAVRSYLTANPDQREDFEQQGIISC